MTCPSPPALDETSLAEEVQTMVVSSLGDEIGTMVLLAEVVAEAARWPISKLSSSVAS